MPNELTGIPIDALLMGLASVTGSLGYLLYTQINRRLDRLESKADVRGTQLDRILAHLKLDGLS